MDHIYILGCDNSGGSENGQIGTLAFTFRPGLSFGLSVLSAAFHIAKRKITNIIILKRKIDRYEQSE